MMMITFHLRHTANLDHNCFAVKQGGIRRISFGQQYTREQQDQILRVLNNSSEKELRKLSISPLNVMRIPESPRGEQRLHQHGPRGCHRRPADAQLGSHLRGHPVRKEATGEAAARPGKQHYPGHTAGEDRALGLYLTVTSLWLFQSITDILAIDVSPPFMTWAHVTRDNFVLALDRVQFLDDKAKPHLYNHYEAVQQVLKQLPKASLYVVEQKSQRHKVEVAQSQSQLTVQAMMVALLSHGKKLQPQVVSVKSSAIANLFNLNVGSERVSGQGTLKKLVDDGTISFQGNLKGVYLKETPVNKEHYCGVLLLARAFYVLAMT
ncbi:hypothetical protein HPB51_006826 [Rhipicephalus microplus]|uniref:Uncharacterized protein n=1 Tax=Rhipicephalus microplus TaxID=6941 RepID=A0A9J6E7Y2_RHIMP|nr:hypothetical protein HPB51_006826 [Rhipicephalus microplus]